MSDKEEKAKMKALKKIRKNSEKIENEDEGDLKSPKNQKDGGPAKGAGNLDKKGRKKKKKKSKGKNEPDEN